MFSQSSDNNICHYTKRALTCHPATSWVRDQDNIERTEKDPFFKKIPNLCIYVDSVVEKCILLYIYISVTNITFTGPTMVNGSRRHLIQWLTTDIMVNVHALGPLLRIKNTRRQMVGQPLTASACCFALKDSYLRSQGAKDLDT